MEELTRGAGLERDRPASASIETSKRSLHGQPWASRPAEGRAGQAHGRSPPSTGGQGVEGQSLEGKSPGEHRPARDLNRRVSCTDRPRDQSPEGESGALPVRRRVACRARTMVPCEAGGVKMGRQGREGNVRRASGAERCHGSAVESKALKGKPQGRYRDETSPEGAWRSKPSRGRETLEAERTGTGNPGSST